jgi:hypothetical protein
MTDMLRNLGKASACAFPARGKGLENNDGGIKPPGICQYNFLCHESLLSTVIRDQFAELFAPDN